AGNRHDEEAILRIEREAEVDAAAQDRRRQVADAHRSPDDDDQLIEDQRKAEGEEQLIVVPGRVKAPDAGVLDRDAEQRDAERGHEEPEPEVANGADDRDEEIGADGEERAVREVREVEDAGDEREPEPHQGIQHARRDPVEDLAEEEVQFGVRATIPSVRSSAIVALAPNS